MTEDREYSEPEEEKPYDAADPKRINAERKKVVRQRQKRINFVRQMMRSKDGRLWVYDLLVMGHIASPTFTPGDPHATSFREGERNIINKILADVNEAAPEFYSKMLIEGRTEI